MTKSETTSRIKPELNFWQIWNMCFGFLGIQFGFALQNANVSRIFQTLGADIDDIPILWIAAPITGLLVQPIVGYLSDKTWNGLGRRRPYFLIGALLTSISLIWMPNASSLWIAAGLLWIMDASINISMEPFRALVGDMLPEKQRAKGFAMQSFFIGIGAVVASMLPWILTNVVGIENTAAEGEIPLAIHYAFYAGAAVLFFAILWTIITTKEYSPEELSLFEKAKKKLERYDTAIRQNYAPSPLIGIVAIFATGLAIIYVIFVYSLDKQLYIFSGGILVFAAILLSRNCLLARKKIKNGYFQIINNLFEMPVAMKQLACVQFFSWFALFSMWIYTTAAITQKHYGTTDVTSTAYNSGADWVGVLFAAYNGFAAVAAFFIPLLARRIGLRVTHLINLMLGGLGLASMLFIQNPQLLLISMVGVGFAWASILSIPYALLSHHLPANKMGVFMGIFNFFIVIPQILAASVLGFIVKTLFEGQPIYALLLGGVFMFVAGILTLRVKHA